MIRKKNPATHIVVDLSGPDGNAFALIGLALRLATQLGYTTEERSALQADLTSGDYEHLLEVFERHFTSLVILERVQWS